MKITFLFFLLIFSVSIFGQIEDAENVYEVIDPTFVPPTESMKANLIGKRITPFMANDIHGKQHFSGSYKGQKLIIFIWNESCSLCTDIALYLQQHETNGTAYVSFFSESKADFMRFMSGNHYDLPVVAGAKFLNQGLFVGELGYPRVFMVDSEGIVKDVLDQADFKTETPFTVIIDESLRKSF